MVSLPVIVIAGLEKGEGRTDFLQKGGLMSARMRVSIVPYEEANETLKVLYDEIRKKRGKIWNIYGAQSHLPEVMKAHLDFYMGLMFSPGGIPRYLREFLGCYVSYLNRCGY